MHLDQTLHNKAEMSALLLARQIFKQDAPTAFAEAFETTLARTLAKEHVEAAEKAAKAAMKKYKGKGTKAEAKSIMAAVNKQMASFGSDALRSAVEDSLAVFYEEVTVKFIRQFDLEEPIEKATGVRQGGVLQGSFTQTDKAAIEAIQKLTVQTAGTYYPEQLMSKTSEVVADVVLESGLPIEQAAVKLENEIRGALGAKEAANVVPARFATNPQEYFQIVASNASVQATSVGRIVSMSDAGIEKYRVSAVMDKRTSNICTNLNGREFSVQKTMGSVNDFIGLDSTAGLKSLMPFNKNDIVPKWADEGLGFPPYHMKCRTTVVPVF